jgi:hypothetical protein
MTLILWKAPVVSDPRQAEAMLSPWYDAEDDSAFTPSQDIALVWDELLRRFPDDGSSERPEDDSSPWADFPPEQTDRILMLHIRWGADNAVLDAIAELARKHELVLYDPQGPSVHLPSDPQETPEEPEPVGPGGYAVAILTVGVGALLFAAGWWVPVPVINWLLMAAGVFLALVGIFLFVAFLGAASGLFPKPSS